MTGNASDSASDSASDNASDNASGGAPCAASRGRRTATRRAWRWVVMAVASLTLSLALWMGVYVWRATPQVSGTARLPGLAGTVRVERDARGVPTVHALTVRDAFFGLGVVHAQDRLWQLETHRRIGSGRLAEAFGEAALGNDRFLRALGVHRAAQAQWDRTPAASREVLQAYADGVNAAVTHLVDALPPEFLVLGLRPEPWTPVDSLAWAIMMAWDLGGNWQSEMQRLRLAARLPDERVHELLPSAPGQPHPAGRRYDALLVELGLAGGATRTAGLDLEADAPPSGVEGVGSNNWVLAPGRSTAEGALLANDPHLKLSAPALWYLARLKAPGLDVAGATMPGVPSVVLGQNDALAWGFTNTGPDVQDLYLEAPDPGRPDHVRTPEGWAPLEVFDELIRVRGGREVAFQARRTRHGPVISDAGAGQGLLGQGAAGEPAPRYLLAMRWTALDADADPVGAGLAMMAARDVDDFVAATRRWVAPMQNMVVADRACRIGFVAAGRVPLRRADNDLHGMFPAPGWDARYDWAGWIDPDATPREFDPPRGWLATANQRIHDVDYPHLVSTDWAPPWRQRRIVAMLEARERHGLDDLARMQSDVRSLAAVHLLPWMRAARPEHPAAAAVQTLLATWDGTMEAAEPAPLIHWAWIRHLTRMLVADELGGAPGFGTLFPQRSLREAVEGILERQDPWWCDDKSTAHPETCAELNDRAMTAALGELSARFGPDPATWRWGDAHLAIAEHRPFSQVRALAPWFELRTPVGGDTYTVNVARVSLKESAPGTAYHSTHGPSLRALYDVAEPRHSRVMHSSGQSGLPWRAAYREFLEPWRRVEYLPLWAEPGAAAAGGALRLEPAPR